MNIRQVRDAPGAACVRRRVEALDIAGLGHGGIGNGPNQRGDREIGRTRTTLLASATTAMRPEDPTVAMPSNSCAGGQTAIKIMQRNAADHDAGQQRGGGAQP